ncbi:putative TIR domain, leucine-rich repeat domain superfamily [Helianthus anomalus]
MACTSSSASRTNPTPTIIRFDVFLSFRGEDTRHNFTDHLYHALLGAGLRTFRDNDELDRGQQLKPEIETAIIESRAYIVVLSEKYADSRWCLDELCLILEQRRKLNRFVLPVFYQVHPSDVRNQRGSFVVERSIWTSVANLTKGFSYCLACLGTESKDGSKWTEVNVRKWKAALTEVANLTGLENSRLMMHQLLQEMGRNVVCEESKDPAKRSRVWHDVESYRMLRKGDCSNTIEGLSLDMRKVEQGMGEALALRTSSLANMVKLKLLQLKYVKLIGSYEKFPELIWLWWHGCPLQTIPPGLLMSSLVAIDMSYGQMEMFEAPTVLNSLKILNLKGCDKLVSICNLYRLPRLNILELWNCSSLTHVCKSIADLENLSRLGFAGCTKLWKYVNQPGKMMLPEQSSFSLPRSLTWLDLSNGGLDTNNDVCTVFHAQSSFELHLAANLFEYLPNNINLKMLRILNLYSCSNLKSLPSIPTTLKELYIDWCTSLERVTFETGRFSLREFAYECCFKLSEIQGLFKLVPIAKINEADLGHLQWIKAYEDLKVDLVGDDITQGNIWHTQMLYEYGIMSTYLQGINDQIMKTYEYTSSSNFVFFHVPCYHEQKRIEGLNVSCLYRSSGFKDKAVWNLWAKISNKSKGVTWVYNPMVYCKPRVDEHVVWVSYWPIGNILDAGDEVSVDIYVDERMIMVGGCGASIVFTDNEVVEEEKCENDTMKEEEVIGGDLSEFEVTTGCYYLCRCDVFGLQTAYWLKKFFGDDVHYADSHRWRKTHQTVRSKELRDYAYTFHKIIELGVSFNSESEIDKIEKVVSSLVGVESVSAHKEMGKLIATGYVDPVEVATCFRKFDNMAVEILSYKILFE